jgi:endonuclease/exonuclease/phosphatase family metal-dependent hydrolase
MRFLLYNIRYGTGSGWHYHVPFPFSGYFRDTRGNLDKLTEFVGRVEPDIIGLIEVDSGSYRSGRSHQAAHIARALGGTHVYESKYLAGSLAGGLPLMRKQGNAFITTHSIEAQKFHYFRDGIKRLCIELEFDAFTIFLVHLSLKFRHRHNQLNDLHALFREATKPVIVAGDFNVLWGEDELALFQAATGLISANREHLPTFPSSHPSMELDFILHSPQIRVTQFAVPGVKYSDHRPLLCDFEVL